MAQFVRIEVGDPDRLLDRQSAAVTNFEHVLPAPQSDLTCESLKDPYRLDFLGLGEEAQERESERALVEHVTEFLLELGAGFAYVGQELHLHVGEEDFYLDLPFYHLKLRCYVVIVRGQSRQLQTGACGTTLVRLGSPSTS